MRAKYVVLLIAIIVFSSSPVLAECTQEEAFNKMMALGVGKSDLQGKWTALPNGAERNQAMQQWATLGQEIAAVGKVLGQKDYPKACAQYDQIASKYALDLSELSKRAPSMAELQAKSGG